MPETDSKSNEASDKGAAVSNRHQEEGTPASAERGEDDNSTRRADDSEAAAAATASGAKQEDREEQEEAPVELSKSQIKKKRRLEHKMEIKKRRKLQEKEAKEARAKAQGRDLDAERREQERRAQAGVGKKRRDARWAKRLEAAKAKFQVCLDCAFESSLTTKEINSLALQLRYCYATNRRVDVPCLLAATSALGQTLEHLKNVAGFDEWGTRGFTCTEKPLEEYYATRKSDLVYLTSDSENVLQDLDDSKIYVIGGIVDRNRLKRAALGRAVSLQIATAKLPLDEHLQKMQSTRVLTCNHVFDILMHYREHKSWEQALLSVLPQRKGAKLAGNNDEEKADEEQEGEQNE